MDDQLVSMMPKTVFDYWVCKVFVVIWCCDKTILITHKSIILRCNFMLFGSKLIGFTAKLIDFIENKV